MADRSRLTVALFVSVLLHALSLGMGTSSWPRQFARPSPPELLDVDLVPFAKVAPVEPPQAVPVPVPQAEPQLLPETQIVSPSAAGEERPPETTNLLSVNRLAEVGREMLLVERRLTSGTVWFEVDRDDVDSLLVAYR